MPRNRYGMHEDLDKFSEYFQLPSEERYKRFGYVPCLTQPFLLKWKTALTPLDLAYFYPRLVRFLYPDGTY